MLNRLKQQNHLLTEVITYFPFQDRKSITNSQINKKTSKIDIGHNDNIKFDDNSVKNIQDNNTEDSHDSRQNQFVNIHSSEREIYHDTMHVYKEDKTIYQIYQQGTDKNLDEQKWININQTEHINNKLNDYDEIQIQRFKDENNELKTIADSQECNKFDVNRQDLKTNNDNDLNIILDNHVTQKSSKPKNLVSKLLSLKSLKIK